MTRGQGAENIMEMGRGAGGSLLNRSCIAYHVGKSSPRRRRGQDVGKRIEGGGGEEDGGEEKRRTED